MVTAGDTIAALATPAGAGGVGVLRVSGPRAARIAEQILGHAPRPRYAHYTPLRDAEGAILDRGLVLFFPHPNSYTGEHVLELHAHGSPVVLKLLLERLYQMGARPARPGEFSERAFLNGKIDLTQAEAVADLIASRSEAAARAAMRSLDGEFSQAVRRLLEGLVQLRVHIEAAMDFAEEEIDFLADPQLLAELSDLRQSVARLLLDARRGLLLRDGLHAVIIGRPNVGKSSVLNALARSDRAIVTPLPGTTRDILREELAFDDIALTLVDTAGLRDSDDLIEREGMRRALAELARADVVLLITDSMHVADDRSLLDNAPQRATRIIVHNKIDLVGNLPKHEMVADETRLWISALTGDGLDLLRHELKRLAGHADGGDGSHSARARHVTALVTVSEHLAGAERALVSTKAGELAAEELRAAQRELGSLTGDFSSDDLLGAIFANFCVGK
jgi:tRNA modification GTPase